jgi:hypothetical protein
LIEGFISFRFDVYRQTPVRIISDGNYVCIARFTPKIVKRNAMVRRRARDRHFLCFSARAEQREQFWRYARSVAIGTPSARTLERASARHPLLTSSLGWRQIEPLFNGSYLGVFFGDYHFCSVVWPAWVVLHSNFTDSLSSRPIVAERNEFRMTKVLIERPLNYELAALVRCSLSQK